jgi:hypothetical protein
MIGTIFSVGLFTAKTYMPSVSGLPINTPQ